MSKYKFSDEAFVDAVKNSFSIREVLLKLGMAPFGGSYKVFKLRAKKLEVDTSHFTGMGHLKGKTHSWSKKIPLTDVLVADSNRVLNHRFKARIISDGLLENKCSECGLGSEWNNKPITLQIDHINGNHFDHRLENIRLLCPNCHSQTITFCSKNDNQNKLTTRKSVYIKQDSNKCKLCNKILKDKNRKHCSDCYKTHRREIQTHFDRPTKINWLPVDELLSKLKTMSYRALARELGVTDNAIRKHIKKYTNNGTMVELADTEVPKTSAQ